MVIAIQISLKAPHGALILEGGTSQRSHPVKQPPLLKCTFQIEPLIFAN
jgi:hypothetical protein